MPDIAPGRDTPPPRHFIQVGSALAIGYWLVEALMDSWFMNVPIATRVVPLDSNELWMRSLTSVLFIAFGVYAHRVQARLRSAETRRMEAEQRLQDALAKILASYIPICAWCKNIRNEDGKWDAPEAFITARTGAVFSHGMCPKCALRYFPGQPEAAS
jgi:hypothetical protein